MSSIQAGPHYEIPSAELATWLELQGIDLWWNVDGDPLLTGRLSFPCPGDELAKELREINRPLLAQAAKGDADAKAQVIDAGKISQLVSRFAGNLRSTGPLPQWANDRFLYMCWKGSPHEWLLAEDSVTTKQFREPATSKTK